MLLDNRIKQQGTVPLHRRVVTLAVPQVEGNAALVGKRLLYTQSTLRQQGVIDTGHFNRGDGTEIITHPIHAASLATLRPGKQPPERDQITYTIDIPQGTECESRPRATVSVGKSFNRTDFRSFYGSEVPEDRTRNLLGRGGSNTVLTNPPWQRLGPFPLGTAPASERAELPPGQVMRPVGFRGIKLTRSGPKEGSTSRLQVPLEHTPAVAQENTGTPRAHPEDHHLQRGGHPGQRAR